MSMEKPSEVDDIVLHRARVRARDIVRAVCTAQSSARVGMGVRLYHAMAMIIMA